MHTGHQFMAAGYKKEDTISFGSGGHDNNRIEIHVPTALDQITFT